MKRNRRRIIETAQNSSTKKMQSVNRNGSIREEILKELLNGTVAGLAGQKTSEQMVFTKIGEEGQRGRDRGGMSCVYYQ